MGKDIKDVAIVVQARLNSTRVPNKMLREFNGTTLVELLLSKLTESQIIPRENIYFSIYEKELQEIANNFKVNIYSRSKESACEETDIKRIFEWHNSIPHKYVILISACNPLLSIETIDNFVKSYLDSSKVGGFAVFEKKTYYWNKDKINLTDWKGLPVMNTKYVDPVYEAAHCLYASKMDLISQNKWMTENGPNDLELFIMNEIEAFDIDYEWQFKVGEVLYRELWKK